MQWLRLKARSGAGLAIFALLLQLGLAAGHVHADQLTGPVHKLAQSHSPTNAEPGSDNAEHDFGACQICHLLALAGTPVLSATLLAVAPENALRELRATKTVSSPVTSPRAAFRSRAPPLS